VFDRLAAVTSDALPKNAIMILQEPVRALVSELLGEVGPTFDVREQQGDCTFDGSQSQRSPAPDAGR
jgi:hypothetical protein